VPADELLKTAEVAELLRVHPKHVYRLLDQGLPGRRVGGEWRFVREEVLAWSAARGGASAPSSRGAPPAGGAVVPPLLGANGDLVIEVLLAQIVAQKRPLVGFVQADRGTALAQLGARTLLLAGFHGERPPAHLEAARLARIHLVERAVGLAHRADLRVEGVADVRRLRIATRPATAGVRGHFDRALAEASLSPDALRARTTTFDSHREAVCAVVRGDADVALTTAAWAGRVGLPFLTLARESYDLLLFAEALGEPHVVGLCEVAQSKAFRGALGAVTFRAPW
jgi:excisionase family DNA binding protein